MVPGIVNVEWRWLEIKQDRASIAIPTNWWTSSAPTYLNFLYSANVTPFFLLFDNRTVSSLKPVRSLADRTCASPHACWAQFDCKGICTAHESHLLAQIQSTVVDNPFSRRETYPYLATSTSRELGTRTKTIGVRQQNNICCTGTKLLYL